MDVLVIRIILNGILAFGFLVGAISLFWQKKNGITRAMAIFTLFAGLHVWMLVLLGIIDVSKPENFAVLNFERIAWNWISFGWLVSGLYLAYVLLKDKDND